MKKLIKKDTTENNVEKKDVPQKKGVRIAKIVLNTIINILIVVVLLTSILIAVMSLSSKANGGVSIIFGKTVLTVQSNSMKGGSEEYEGGNFEEGDLLLGMDVKSKDIDFEIGDIISFKAKDINGKEYINTHRIVDKYTDVNGAINLVTKGDNNETRDPDPVYSYDVVSLFHSKDYDGKLIKGVGGFLDYIKEPQGFFLVVLLPMIIFFLYEILRVVLNAMNYKKSKAKQDKEDAEREKQEAVEAAVKAALEEKGKSAGEEKAPADLSEDQMAQFKQFLAFQEAQKAQKAEEPSEAAAEEIAEEAAKAAEEAVEESEAPIE